MRIWVEKRDQGIYQVNFQPDNQEESRHLDNLLRFNESMDQRLSTEAHRTVADGAPSIARLVGHETQRWITIIEPVP